MSQQTMKILYIAPGKEPEVKEIPTGLESMQHEVEDPVALICNDEGKINGLPLNRALKDDSGKIYDVIAGNFLVVGLTDDDFGSLSDELIEKFRDKFMPPEIIFMLNGQLMALPMY